MAVSDSVDGNFDSRPNTAWTIAKRGLTFFLDGLAYAVSLAFSIFYHLAPMLMQSGGMALLAILAIAGPVLLLSRLFQRKLTILGWGAVLLPIVSIVSTWLIYDVLGF
jgi:hypothetical protein